MSRPPSPSPSPHQPRLTTKPRRLPSFALPSFLTRRSTSTHRHPSVTRPPITTSHSLHALLRHTHSHRSDGHPQPRTHQPSGLHNTTSTSRSDTLHSITTRTTDTGTTDRHLSASDPSSAIPTSPQPAHLPPSRRHATEPWDWPLASTPQPTPRGRLEARQEASYHHRRRSLIPLPTTLPRSATQPSLLQTMTPNPASPSPAGPNPSAPPDPMRITAAQPRDYWAGRFSALADRFRAEEANGMVAEGDGAGEARVADQDERRKERAMRALEAVCAGVEARGSLMEFQRALERRARLCAQKSSGSEEKGFRRWFKGRKSGA